MKHIPAILSGPSAVERFGTVPVINVNSKLIIKH